jgi:hypothetical protein
MNSLGSGHHNILQDFRLEFLFKVFSEVLPPLQKLWTS